MFEFPIEDTALHLVLQAVWKKSQSYLPTIRSVQLTNNDFSYLEQKNHMVLSNNPFGYVQLQTRIYAKAVGQS